MGHSNTSKNTKYIHKRETEVLIHNKLIEYSIWNIVSETENIKITVFTKWHFKIITYSKLSVKLRPQLNSNLKDKDLRLISWLPDSGPFGAFSFDVHVNRASLMYQPGAPAALPGKMIFGNIQKSKRSDIYKENLGPPVVGPCFSKMLGFGANNSTDTNKNNSSFSFEQRWDENIHNYNTNKNTG